MKKQAVILLFSLFCFRSFSSHIVGGDITVKHISGNDFEVTLRFYRDCLNGLVGFDNQVTIGVFDKVTNALAFQFNMSLISQDSLSLGDSCFTPDNLCVEEGIYQSTETFPNNPNGYYLSWQRCCRNNIILNITDPTNTGPDNSGMVFYVEIPDPVLGNSTPVFGSYPNAYMCTNLLNTQNFSAIDIDGDSLVYSLITPLNGNSGTSSSPPPTPGPYANVNWVFPYSASDMMGGSPILSINGQTGILTATPSTLGVFVFAVRVEEYKNGVKLGEIRRDIQYQVLVGNINSPPSFDFPVEHSYTVIAGDSICIPVKASDPNDDWMILNRESEPSSTSQPDIQFIPDSATADVQSILCVQTNCSHIRDTPYRIVLSATDSSCYGSNTIYFEIEIYVKAPLDGKMDSIISNIFTPNGDGYNDFFQIGTENIQECFDHFNIQIYGRWGHLVHESTDFYFKWDGKNKKGNEMPAGVYYYMINATFKDKPLNYNGFIHLIR